MVFQKLRAFDFLGPAISLKFDSSPVYKTWCGACLSLLSILTIATVFIIRYQDLVTGKSYPTIVRSEKPSLEFTNENFAKQAFPLTFIAIDTKTNKFIPYADFIKSFELKESIFAGKSTDTSEAFTMSNFYSKEEKNCCFAPAKTSTESEMRKHRICRFLIKIRLKYLGSVRMRIFRRISDRPGRIRRFGLSWGSANSRAFVILGTSQLSSRSSMGCRTL
jgi:thiol-disulfide isomerase/thioredoxin